MKITKEQQNNTEEFYGKLVEKAWNDENFKREILENPKEAIESLFETKFDLPNDTKIVVEDQSNPNYIYLNVPRKVSINDFELTDEQLEQVAGGDFVIIPGAIIAGIATVALIVAAVAYFSRE